jgi:L-threonylcarbamoyladenylate synthase
MNHPDESFAILAHRHLVRDWPLDTGPPPWALSKIVHMPHNPTDYGRILYSTLHDLDARSIETLFIQMPIDEPQWLAVRDRLLRATRPLPPEFA